ncbi:MAG: fatty acid--CoA ligase [Chromatiales bacterium]|nr:fatty acid--CoA ligase [Chromatiales bacterium]
MLDPTATAPADEAFDDPLLIGSLLRSTLVVAAEREIVHEGRVRLTYRTWRERVGRLASALQACGIGPGDTVAVMDWDSHRYLECFFAVPMMGAVLHTVNIRLSPEQIRYTIDHADDAAIIVHRDFVPMLEAIAPSLRARPRIITIDDGGPPLATTLETVGEYEVLLASADADFEFPALDERTRATTFYTTGTTGEPKGVHYSHRKLVLHTLSVATAVGSASGQGRFHRDDVYMPVTPMFHVHAWGIPYVATLLGVKQVYPGRYEPAKLLRLIAEEGVTFSHGVPTLLHMLLEHPDSAAVDLGRLKMVVGGSAMSRGLAAAALARGIDAFAGYGMSETCPVLTVAHLDAAALAAPPDEQIRLRCKTGRPLPLIDLRVADEDLAPVPRDGSTVGEVVVRAPWFTPGYLADRERSNALWRGGWLHTGDLGHQDAAGYLQVTDRLKDVIKSGGEWISSLVLEDLASRIEGVGEAAAIGVPDARWGERPLLLVVPAGGRDLGADAVRAHFERAVERGEISRYAVPERIEIVDAIAKTSVGKIDKKRLRTEWAGD